MEGACNTCSLLFAFARFTAPIMEGKDKIRKDDLSCYQ